MIGKPIATCSCGVTLQAWEDLTTLTVWVQHGDNPEARRNFDAKELFQGRSWLPFATRRDLGALHLPAAVIAWIDAIHVQGNGHVEGVRL